MELSAHQRLSCARLGVTPSLYTPRCIPNPTPSLQHLFIPIVPSEMLDYCSAPVPFLVGLRPSEFQSLLDMKAGEVKPGGSVIEGAKCVCDRLCGSCPRRALVAVAGYGLL